jgi:primosomal protein N' (replication factor Y)
VANATKEIRKGITIKPIDVVHDLPSLPPQLIATAAWLKDYYRSAIGSLAQAVLPPTIPKKLPTLTKLTPLQKPRLSALTGEQGDALKHFSKPDTYLLHGRTGSGKTRLYQELAQRELVAGRSVLILSPEIGLTGQLAQSFTVFGKDRVVVLHSGLTAKERFEAWYTVLCATEPLIVVGPRSALFSPLKNLGLIVVDEAHESAYKQEQEPRYNSLRVASQLAHAHDATLLYGTATPLVSEYYLAQQKQKPIIRLTELAKSNIPDAITNVIDLKDRALFTKSSFISDPLITSMRTSLEHGEQSLLYLNRRGTARVALCQNCGWQAVCPRCDIPLIYHGDTHNLRCHTCGFTQTVPVTCPDCGQAELIFRQIGTKAVVDEVHRLFPDARIKRFDSDNLKAERLEHHISAMQAGDVDIIIGTQTIAKGLDLPRLSTLGVLMADTSLNMPDYTAAERTYQLLNQVMGRVGRGHVTAHTIIQTYHPASPLIDDAIHDNWQSFYTAELKERETFLYPPFCYLLKIVCKRASARSAEQACEKVRQQILESHRTVHIDGPAPALHETMNGSHYWQLIVKAKQRSQLLDIIDNLPANTLHDIDPLDLL